MSQAKKTEYSPAEAKDAITSILERARAGEERLVVEHGQAVAVIGPQRVVSPPPPAWRLGFAKGTGEIHGDLVAPLFPDER